MPEPPRDVVHEDVVRPEDERRAHDRVRDAGLPKRPPRSAPSRGSTGTASADRRFATLTCTTRRTPARLRGANSVAVFSTARSNVVSPALEPHPVRVVERVRALEARAGATRRTPAARPRRSPASGCDGSARPPRERANAPPACEKRLRDVAAGVRERAGDDVELGHASGALARRPDLLGRPLPRPVGGDVRRSTRASPRPRARRAPRGARPRSRPSRSTSIISPWAGGTPRRRPATPSRCIPRCGRWSALGRRVRLVEDAQDHERAVPQEDEPASRPQQPRGLGDPAYGSHQMLAPYSETARSNDASGSGTSSALASISGNSMPGLGLHDAVPSRAGRA